MLLVYYAFHNNACKLSACKNNLLYLFFKLPVSQCVFLGPSLKNFFKNQELENSTQQFN